MRLWPRPTATGAPRTMFGYYLGQLSCRVGLHKPTSITYWQSGRGDFVSESCRRDRCDWGVEWWTFKGRPRRRGHRVTDPACVWHREPRGRFARWRFDRGRGWSCQPCLEGRRRG